MDHTISDDFTAIGFVRHPDGSVTRQTELRQRIPSTDVSSYSDNSILLVKDIPVNQSNSTWVRVFLPRKSVESSPDTKLPTIIFIHGGGFLVASAASSFFDDFHAAMTVEIPAVILSLEYRLAPEHRLPAAYEDAMEFLLWIKTCRDEWLIKYADFSNSFIMGNSAGGNIAYHVGLLAASSADELKPLNIKGLILHQPFFGGVERTQSELRSSEDKILPLRFTDITWELALPVGADRDHEFSNPMVGVKYDLIDQVKASGWKVLITGYEGDPVIDRQMELAKMLEEKGIAVVGKFEKGGYHGIEFYEVSKLKPLCEVLKEFVASSMDA